MASSTDPVASGPTPTTTLRRGAVGLVGAATLGAIMMSPALGLYGNWGPLAQDIGVIGPLIFLLGLLIALPTAISYASIARVMPSSGSAYTWLWRSLTPSAGIFIGWILIGYYIVAVILQPYLFGLYFNELLAFLGITGVSTYVGGVIGVLLVTAVAAFFVYGGIQLSIRGTVILIAFESLVAGGLALTIILTKAGQGDLSFAPFDPSQIGGAKDIGLALIIMVLSYTGFDVISTVAEETHSPRTLIPRATIARTLRSRGLLDLRHLGPQHRRADEPGQRSRQLRGDPDYADRQAVLGRRRDPRDCDGVHGHDRRVHCLCRRRNACPLCHGPRRHAAHGLREAPSSVPDTLERPPISSWRSRSLRRSCGRSGSTRTSSPRSSGGLAASRSSRS